jgi:hypothetical protein
MAIDAATSWGEQWHAYSADRLAILEIPFPRDWRTVAQHARKSGEGSFLGVEACGGEVGFRC